VQRRWYGDDPARTGELDTWRHDRLSLGLLLEQTGFERPHVCAFDESSIPGWERYQLDRSEHGNHPIEPSLHLECNAARKLAVGSP
jgi:hypothetical protein